MKKYITLATFVVIFFASVSCKEDLISMQDVDTQTPADTIKNPYPADTVAIPRPGDPQSAMDKRVFIRPMIQVGSIMYDSIPAQLIVKSWDAKDEMDYRIHYLAAGTQAIYLSAKAIRFQLSVTKWGASTELALLQSEVKENNVYEMIGKVPARRLKSVTEVKITEGVSRPQTKTDYEYHANGEIRHRLIWGKKADMSTYLIQKDIFTYTAGNITSIQSFDGNNVLLKTLSARYNTEGRVVQLDEVAGANRISATAWYLPVEPYAEVGKAFRIDVQYKMENGAHTDYYSKIMSGGSGIHDMYARHTGGREEGYYDYDSAINPFAQLKIPDLLFTQHHTHNMVFPRKQYSHGRPQYEAYDLQYTYDAQGYPKELLTRYRSSYTKMDTHTTRTIFTY